MKIIKNKPSKELLHKLYIVDDLSSINIAKIYSCDPTTICNWLRKYDIHLRSYSEATIKVFENPDAHEKARDAQNKYWEDPLIRDKQRERAIKQWKDPSQHEKARERLFKLWNDPLYYNMMVDAANNRWDDPLKREKIRDQMNDYWKNPVLRERQSAIKQGQNYDDGEWTGWTNKNRPHLIPINQCIHLNPWFEGCNQHHIMTGVIINIPSDLHKGVRHRMPNDNKEEKNMKKINKLSFKYLLGEL